MDLSIIYTKTAKGVVELKNGTKGFPSSVAATLKRVNGHSTVAALLAGLSDEAKKLEEQNLAALQARQLIRVFVRQQETLEPVEVDQVLEMDAMPLLRIEELSPEEGVRAWAEARRGARELVQQGFYATAHISPDGVITHDLSALIVEDDPAISLLMKTYLTKRGFAVTVVADGREALHTLDQNPRFSIVLLDVNLPNINGFDILAYIRDQASLKNLPAVMVTAQVSDADVLRGLKGGADGYIFKPFEWSAFYACIRKVLNLSE